MKLLKLAAGIVNTTPLDWDGNKAAIVGAIRAAKADGVSILCLPEMCLCGYAPSFHVDDKDLGPKTWCRSPILSGGFERELAELRSLLEQPKNT